MLLALAGLVWAWLDLSALERWLAALGPWGPAAFVLLFVIVTPALVPDSPFAAIAGALFGLAWGTALTAAAAVLAATVTFGIARWLFRDAVRRRLEHHPRLAVIERVVSGGQTRLLVLLRVVPLNPALVNYLLATTGIGFGRYLLSCVGLVPAYFAAAYVGWLARLAGDDAHRVGLPDYVAGAGFVATVLVLVLATRAARQALREAAPMGPAPRD